METGIIQILMSEFNGLGVILENRYYGESLPFGNSSTTDELAYLSNEQSERPHPQLYLRPRLMHYQRLRTMPTSHKMPSSLA